MSSAIPIAFSLYLFLPALAPAQADSGFAPTDVMIRVSTASRIIFNVGNDGALLYPVVWGEFPVWPRETNGQLEYCFNLWDPGGLWFGCKKEGRVLVSGAAMTTTRLPQVIQGVHLVHQTFNQFVPGYIGDPQASADTAFGFAGWRYVNNQNYTVYSSIDYDSSGEDVSGNNFPDWPLRLVVGKEAYVQQLSQRRHYPPIVKSDEDFFVIYKDTDTRNDVEFMGAHAAVDSASMPIGIEVRQYCYTWSTTLLRNAIVYLFDIHNKSRAHLDSCFVGTSLSMLPNASGYGGDAN
jgi:hypothetical protein